MFTDTPRHTPDYPSQQPDRATTAQAVGDIADINGNYNAAEAAAVVGIRPAFSDEHDGIGTVVQETEGDLEDSLEAHETLDLSKQGTETEGPAATQHDETKERQVRHRKPEQQEQREQAEAKSAPVPNRRQTVAAASGAVGVSGAVDQRTETVNDAAVLHTAERVPAVRAGHSLEVEASTEGDDNGVEDTEGSEAEGDAQTEPATATPDEAGGSGRDGGEGVGGVSDRYPLPRGWRRPTAETVAQYKYGVSNGLVSAGHPGLSQAAEVVSPGEVTGSEVVSILGRMYHVIQAMGEVKRPIAGLAAPQIGEEAQIVLVPRQPGSEDVGYGDFMPVINPVFKPIEGQQKVVPHGCFSANEVFARLPSSTKGELTGLDLHGEPLRDPSSGAELLVREGFHAVVDEHEVRHLAGMRAADVAVGIGQQLDCRPPSEAQRYRDFFAAWEADPTIPEWDYPYPYAQWQAVRSGEFTLDRYLDE
jgi:peptide deformylase